MHAIQTGTFVVVAEITKFVTDYSAYEKWLIFLLLLCRADWSGRGGRAKGYVGMPCCHGFGSAIYADQRLRFVVIDRLGSDLEKFFQSGEKPFPLVTVLRVAAQVLDALEFIHSKSYVHNDVKGQNLLLGFTPEQAENVYLVDFGLACKYR